MGGVRDKKFGEKFGRNYGENYGEKHRKDGAAIIQVMSENPEVTIAELSKTLSRSTSAIEKQIKKLQEISVNRRVGPDKGGRWKVLKQI